MTKVHTCKCITKCAYVSYVTGKFVVQQGIARPQSCFIECIFSNLVAHLLSNDSGLTETFMYLSVIVIEL